MSDTITMKLPDMEDCAFSMAICASDFHIDCFFSILGSLVKSLGCSKTMAFSEILKEPNIVFELKKEAYNSMIRKLEEIENWK